MRINRISSLVTPEGCVYKNNRKKEYCNQTTPLISDTVSFKSGVPGTLTLFVVKEGYNALRTDLAKAKYAAELYKRIKNPDLSNKAKQIIDTIFALAKSPAKDEPKGELYDTVSRFQFGDVTPVRIGAMRNLALKELFPLIPEFSDDNNHGHAAKVALLTSLVDTGEYTDSYTFLDAFNSLSQGYKDDKVFLIKKMLKDKNVYANNFGILAENDAEYAHEHYRDYPWWTVPLTPFGAMLYMSKTKDSWKKKYIKENQTELQNDARNKMNIANTAIISRLNKLEYGPLYQYRDDIMAQADAAFKSVIGRVISYKNCFFEKYADGFWGNPYERDLIKLYFLDLMASIHNDKKSVMDKFCVDEKHAKELIKDYEFIDVSRKSSDLDKIKKLFVKRINEKFSSDSTNIKESGKGLIELSGRREDLLPLLQKKEEEMRPKTVPQSTCSTTGYDNDGNDDLESWERASLETPWIVL